MQLSIIAPTYNEAENNGFLISELEHVLHHIQYEIVVCDDDSPDLTWAHAQEISNRNRRVRVIRRTGERGLGPAVVEGFQHAQGEAVACIDADLQQDPSIQPRMIEVIQDGSDLVVGSRYVPGGGTAANWTRLRQLESWVATKMAKCLLGIRLSDPMSGYFMLRRRDFLRVCPQLNADGFKILVEIVAHLKPSHVCEVPYTFRTRTRGESKLSGQVVLAYLRQLWRLSALEKIRR